MDFNFPQHLLILLFLNTAFLSFFQYVDKIYRDAIKEVADSVRASSFNPDDRTKNKSKIYERIKKLYEPLRDPVKLDNNKLSIAYLFVYIVSMFFYFLYFVSYFLPNFVSYFLPKIDLTKIWIITLAIVLVGLFIIIILTRPRVLEMIKQVETLRHKRKEFLDLLDAHMTDEKKRREEKKT